MRKFCVTCMSILMLVMCAMFLGCDGVKPSQPMSTETKFEKIVKDLVAYQNKVVKSDNVVTVQSGVYIMGTINTYYSINLLSTLSFEGRVSILDSIDTDPKVVYVVVGDRAKPFLTYSSVQDTISNGVVASTVVPLNYTVWDNEGQQSIFPNGTTLVSIEVTIPPSKTDYIFGEFLDIAGLKVVGYYLDGTLMEVPITMGDISGYNSSLSGVQTITVKYLGRVTSFNVNVSNVFSTVNFTFLRNIDILRLKQYSANITLSSSDVSTVVMTTSQGGIAPNVTTVVDKVATFNKITLDVAVTKITLRAFNASGVQIGSDYEVTLLK